MLLLFKKWDFFHYFKELSTLTEPPTNFLICHTKINIRLPFGKFPYYTIITFKNILIRKTLSKKLLNSLKRMKSIIGFIYHCRVHLACDCFECRSWSLRKIPGCQLTLNIFWKLSPKTRVQLLSTTLESGVRQIS